MSYRRAPRTSGPAASGEQPARNETPVPAGGGAISRLGQVSVRCPACGHVTVPTLLCGACGCGEGFHNLAGDGITRKACSTHTGPQGTPCGCKKFVYPTTPEDAR